MADATRKYVPKALIDAVNAEKKAKRERIDRLNADAKRGLNSHVSILTTLVASKTITEQQAADKILSFIREQTALVQKEKNRVGPAVAKLTELLIKTQQK